MDNESPLELGSPMKWTLHLAEACDDAFGKAEAKVEEMIGLVHKNCLYK
jgi:hypothetical protein